MKFIFLRSSEIAKLTGVERIAKMARRLGLGGKCGVDLPGEKEGLIPTKKWKKEKEKLEILNLMKCLLII